jgi:hypothetical protein
MSELHEFSFEHLFVKFFNFLMLKMIDFLFDKSCFCYLNIYYGILLILFT